MCIRDSIKTISQKADRLNHIVQDVFEVSKAATGNTLSKIAAGITDTPVTMGVKSALRIGIPVVLCCATNDAMAASGPNLLRLLNTKNVYLVPLRQDDPVKKPVSLVADFTLLPQAVSLALEGKQLQPVFLPPQTAV